MAACWEQKHLQLTVVDLSLYSTKYYADDHTVPATIRCRWEVGEHSICAHQSIPGSILRFTTFCKHPERDSIPCRTLHTFWSVDRGLWEWGALDVQNWWYTAQYCCIFLVGFFVTSEPRILSTSTSSVSTRAVSRNPPHSTRTSTLISVESSA